MPTPDERRRFARQTVALRASELSDEGDLAWQYWLIEDANERRVAKNIAPLQTEGELHRRARALGLLD